MAQIYPYQYKGKQTTKENKCEADMPLDKARIWLDVNGLCDFDEQGAPIYLFSQADIVNDSDGNDVELYEGMEVSVFDNDLDESNQPDALLAEGIIIRNTLGLYPMEKWLIKLTKNKVNYKSGSKYGYWMSDIKEKMNRREIAVVVSNANKGVHAYDTIDAIHNAGFKNVFIQWYNRRGWNPTQEEQLRYVREKGLNVIFVHLGYQNINDLWIDTEDGTELVEGYKSDIKICKEHNIPMVVMHLTGKSEAPKYNEIGLKRLQEIVDYAETLDMKVAFENTKWKGYLEYVMEHIKNDNAGICFDSGHYHVHFDDDLDFSKFKDKIFAVHLHDNDKSDDLHFMPFDGTIDWTKIIKELISCNYQGPVTLELCYRYQYLEMGIDNFYKKGYEVGEKLREMFEMEE